MKIKQKMQKINGKLRLNRDVRVGRVLLLFSLLSICLYVAGCIDGDSNGAPASAIRMEFKMDLDSSYAAKPAQFDVTWKGELLQATGTGGTDASFNIKEDYSGFYDANGDYTAVKYIQGRRPGTWKLSVIGNGWPAECEVNLPPSKTTVVTFTYQQGGCLSH